MTRASATIIAAMFSILPATAFAHDHFAQMPNFRAAYPAERVFYVPFGETKWLPSGDWDLIQADGTIYVPRGENISLTYNEFIINPVTGFLDCGTEADPVLGNIDIVEADRPLLAIDPMQWGKGLLIYGRAEIHGRQVSKPIVRLGSEARVGQSVILADCAECVADWRVGDRLIIPDTRQIPNAKPVIVYTSQAEELIIKSIDGAAIELTAPLKFDHIGQFLPHVGNLTRNIVFRSANPNNFSRRGHVLVADRAYVDCTDAAFIGLGRTHVGAPIDDTTLNADGSVQHLGNNQRGRYSFHFHHNWGPVNPTNTGHQGRFERCVVDDFLKWGPTIHSSHYHRVAGNIVYAGRGDNTTAKSAAASSAIATEIGDESYNEIEGNFVVHSKAGSKQKILNNSSTFTGGITNKGDVVGRDGIWLTGGHNYVRNNIIANCPDIGINYNGHETSTLHRIPKFRGADMSNPDETELLDPPGLPVLESADNEIYRATGIGLWISYPQGQIQFERRYSDKISTFKGYKISGITSVGVEDWGVDKHMRMDNFIIHNDPSIVNAVPSYAMDFGKTYYENADMRVTNGDIRGYDVGIALPFRPGSGAEEDGFSTFEDLYVDCPTAIEDRYARFIRSKTTYLRNLQLGPTNKTAIWMHPDNEDNHTFMMALSKLVVENFNGTGDDYRVYFKEQAPNAIIPPYRDNRGENDPTLPGVGLTNSQAWEQYKIAIAGEVAPTIQYDGDNGDNALQRGINLGIDGLVFPLDLPPATVHRLVVNAGEGSGNYEAGTSVTITATAPDGKRFQQWIGDTSTITNIRQSPTTLTMPNFNVGISATFEDIPAIVFALVVEGGSGSGDYEAGATVNIAANIPQGMRFVTWSGDTEGIANVLLPNTTFRMPATATTITAVTEPIPPPRYDLSVNGGTGSGSYVQGDRVTISALVPEHYKFVQWTGDPQFVLDANSPTTIVEMPMESVRLTAEFAYVPTTEELEAQIRTLTAEVERLRAKIQSAIGVLQL